MQSTKININMFPLNQPFFVKDIAAKNNVGRSSIVNYMKYHRDFFEETGNKREPLSKGRPEIEYRVRKDAIFGKS